jgi:uncharacterized membrane protein
MVLLGIALVVFCGVSLMVRQRFHAETLATGLTTLAEIYSYSVAWLLLGIALLVIGVWRHHALLRSASLLVLLCTVGKVFLYDASELTGLYRVASFFGLGLSLLALSWFYSKRVFRDAKDAITAH